MEIFDIIARIIIIGIDLWIIISVYELNKDKKEIRREMDMKDKHLWFAIDKQKEEIKKLEEKIEELEKEINNKDK